jgi:hypothetical protein
MTLLRLTVFAAIALAGQAAHAAADLVPRYDVEPGCRSVARAAENPRKDAQACIDEELRLRDELAGKWSTLHAKDKARCTRRLGAAWRPPIPNWRRASKSPAPRANCPSSSRHRPCGKAVSSDGRHHVALKPAVIFLLLVAVPGSVTEVVMLSGPKTFCSAPNWWCH